MFSKEKWLVAYVKAHTDLSAKNPQIGPSDSVVGALASARFIRDNYGLPVDKAKALIADVQSACQPGQPGLAGFLCNCSSASAAAKLKGAANAAAANAIVTD